MKERTPRKDDGLTSEECIRNLIDIYLSLTTFGQMKLIQALKNIEDEHKKPTYITGKIIQFPTDQAKRPLPSTPTKAKE